MNIALIRFRLTCILVLAILWGSCTTFQPEMIVKKQNIALLRLSDKDYPDSGVDYRDQIPAPQDFPDITQEKLIDMLGSLKYIKKGLWSTIVASVYHRDELPDLADTIHQALPSLKPDERLLVISRYDPDKTVISRTYLNTMLLWYDATGYNLVFGVIHEPLDNDNFQMDDDWIEILPVSLKRSYRNVRLKKEDYFSYKSINNIKHESWAIISEADLAKLKYVPESNPDKTANSDEPEGDAQNQKSPTERLRALKQAYEEGLISDDEYDQQREKIIKEY